MEQPIRQQPQESIIFQDNKNKMIIAIIISVVITALVVGFVVYFFTMQELNNVIKQQNTRNSNQPIYAWQNSKVKTTEKELQQEINSLKNQVKLLQQSKHQDSDNVLVSVNNNTSSMNPKDYSLINYPLEQSPIYNQLDKDCFDSYWADAKDTRLVKNQTQVIVPSLLQLIFSSENQKPNCAISVNIFSVPDNGKYLYLETWRNIGSDTPYSGLSGLYRLDLSNLSIKKLTVTKFLSTTDLYRGNASDSYQLLPDGKRLVKWNMNGVYLVNLETDSQSDLYITKPNQWLISRIIFAMGQIAEYDVKINNNQVVIGVYDKIKTQDGYPIKIDQYGNVNVEVSTWERVDDIFPKFINRITIPVVN